MRMITLLLMAATLGCGSSGPCADRQGSYIVDFNARTGNCGSINEAVVNLGPGGTPTSCTGSSQTSTDNCSVETTLACPLNNGETVQENGQITWSTDGSTGSGTIGVVLVDGSGNALCSGTYDVHYQRQ